MARCKLPMIPVNHEFIGGQEGISDEVRRGWSEDEREKGMFGCLVLEIVGPQTGARKRRTAAL